MRVLGEMATKAATSLSNPTALAHYKQEFGRIEFVLRNIYQVVPEEEVSLTSLNADLLEDIGQKWAIALEEAMAEALSVFPVREDEELALLLVGSLVSVMAITEDPYNF